MNSVEEYYEYHASKWGTHLPWGKLNSDTKEWWLDAFLRYKAANDSNL